MTGPDFVNGCFEAAGSVFTWANAYRVYKDRGYAGIYLPAIVVFMSWGIWNLYYYPHLGQWLSFLGGVSLVLANLTWASLAYKFGRK